MPPPIATKFTKLVLTILAITILGIILSFVSQDHTLLIKWFLSRVGNYVDVAEDGQSFTFRPKAKQMHFERSYHTFLDKVCELTGISLGAFVGETKYDIGMAMYKLNDCFNDMLHLEIG